MRLAFGGIYRHSLINSLTRNTRMPRRMILNPQSSEDVPIRGIIFDMDGTLCLPQTWMFAEMRSEIGLKDRSVDILDFIGAMSPEDQEVANRKIANVEKKAMEQMEPQPGLIELMKFLTSNNIPKAICTRNLIVPVNHLISSFIPDVEFDPIVTRAFTPPKPHPAPIQHIADHWGIPAENVIMVGDSIDDMKSGSSAGAATILIKTHANEHVRGRDETDYVVDSLMDIVGLMQQGFIRKD